MVDGLTAKVCKAEYAPHAWWDRSQPLPASSQQQHWTNNKRTTLPCGDEAHEVYPLRAEKRALACSRDGGMYIPEQSRLYIEVDAWMCSSRNKKQHSGGDLTGLADSPTE